MEGLRQWKQIPVQGVQFWGAGRKLHKPGACVQAEEEPGEELQVERLVSATYVLTLRRLL